MKDWIRNLTRTVNVDQMTEVEEPDAVPQFIDRLFANRKRRSNLKIIKGFAVERPTWIHALPKKMKKLKRFSKLLDHRNHRKESNGGKKVRF